MLNEYRKQIDEIDRKIIELLAERLQIVKKVGEYKKEHNIQPLQPERWKEVVQTRRNLAKKYGINPDLIEDIWNLIHQEALKLEKF